MALLLVGHGVRLRFVEERNGRVVVRRRIGYDQTDGVLGQHEGRCLHGFLIVRDVSLEDDEQIVRSSVRYEFESTHLSMQIVLHGDTRDRIRSVWIFEEENGRRLLDDRLVIGQSVEVRCFSYGFVVLFLVVFDLSSFALLVLGAHLLLLILVGHRDDGQDEIDQIERSEEDHRNEIEKMISARSCEHLEWLRVRTDSGRSRAARIPIDRDFPSSLAS